VKGKIFVVVVLVLFATALLLGGQQVKASSHSAAAFDRVFTAINSGETDTAIASFVEDSTASNMVRSETYTGTTEIRQMLQGMQRDGRYFDLVDIQRNGDLITARVEVSDGGIVWGTEIIEARLKGDKLQSFTVTAFLLELWRIGQ
jgi:hypothetical protein